MWRKGGFAPKVRIRTKKDSSESWHKRGFASSAKREIRMLLFVRSERTWRKREDSNLRDGHPPTRFRVVRLQPLGHASVHYFIIKNYFLPRCAKICYNNNVTVKSDAHLISRWMSKASTYAPVAQLDRAFACGAKGRRFESCRVYQNQKKTPKESYFDSGILARIRAKVRTEERSDDVLILSGVPESEEDSKGVLFWFPHFYDKVIT